MPIPAGFEHITRENEPLAPYTWLRVGGAAQYFAEPTSVEELAALVRRCYESGLTVRVLGGGSKLGHIISTAVREGLAGLETLMGIPGTVGGALHTNAGTHSGDIGHFT